MDKFQNNVEQSEAWQCDSLCIVLKRGFLSGVKGTWAFVLFVALYALYITTFFCIFSIDNKNISNHMQQYYELFVDINIYRGSIKICTGMTNTSSAQQV